MIDHWTLYSMVRADGVRHGLCRKLKKQQLPPGQQYRMWITLHFKAQPNFLPSESDLDIFQEFADYLVKLLGPTGTATLVGVVTFDGKRDHLLYLDIEREDECYDLVRPLLDVLAIYRPEVELSHDPTHSQWQDLFGC